MQFGFLPLVKVQSAVVVKIQSAPTPLPDIRIELQRGATTAVVRWPVQAAASCAAWLRALLAPMTSSSPAGGPA